VLTINKREKELRKLLITDGGKAIRVLYRLYYEKILRVSSSMTLDVALSKDIVQEVFLSVWERRKWLGRIQDKSIEHYLIRSAINRSISLLKTNAARKAVLVSLFSGGGVIDPRRADSGLLEEELGERIRRDIMSLPPQARICFLLSRNLSMTYREIAGFLGLSEKTVQAHISYALNHLRKSKFGEY
jgi:RNA polymerase sigma factor (sigma-70 family)